MTIPLEFRIGNLLTELFANAFIVLRSLQTAGAITAGSLQSLFDGLHHFLIFIQSDCHGTTSLPEYYSKILQKVNTVEISESIF